MSEQALVKNAADAQQVRKAEGKTRSIRDEQLDDVRQVVSTPAGRRVMWRLMYECKVFESIWSPSAAIHYNAGKQDFGHFLMGEIISADQESYLLMQKENQNGRG